MDSSASKCLRSRLLRTTCLAAILFVAAAWFSRASDLDQISAILESEGIAGGVLAVSFQGELITQEVIGRSTSAAIPLTASTVFPLASLSKPVTASTVRTLARTKALSLNDSVGKYIPGLDPHNRELGDLPTIAHLLEHRSGLDESSGDPLFLNGETIGCRVAVTHPLRFSSTPGYESHYSNLGYCLLGIVIEKVTGLPYEEASRQTLALPSSFSVGPPRPPVTREGWSLQDEVWSSLGPAGGWFADAQSFAHFAALDATDVTIPLPHRHTRSGFYYGKGWRVWPSTDDYLLTHFGALPGVFTVVVAKPEGRAVVLVTNGRPRNQEETFQRLLGPLSSYLD